MKWVIVDDSSDKTIYGRVDDDGLIRVTYVAEHAELMQWLNEGNIPEPWDNTV
jgi:hypothetical protein